MIARRSLLAGLAATGAAAPALAQPPPPDLAVGQEWSIKAAPPTTAKVIIGRIEPWPAGGTAVSISVIDVPTDHGPIAMGHFPFDEPALVASLDQLLATGVAPPPMFEEGYQQWKSAKGGIFTISVAQVIALVLDQMRQHDMTPAA